MVGENVLWRLGEVHFWTVYRKNE